MLYLFYGSGKKHEKVKKLTDSLDLPVFTITDLDFTLSKFEELTGAQGLFSKRSFFIFDHVLESKETEEILALVIGDLAKSDNTFIFIENEISSDLLIEFKEKGKVFISAGPSFEKPRFNIFSLTDAIGARDKKRGWLELLKALANLPPEEVTTMMLWQLKTMMLVKRSLGKEELGLNPFVARKAQASNRNFSFLELKNLSKNLVSLFHEGRRRNYDLAFGLEKFVLSL